ncbi:MAG: ABC transporter ATP-binding protein [Actinobacteria bacterium]|nr:ABC transporter ATP-binding protein [Actinomycetota bacterium]
MSDALLRATGLVKSYARRRKETEFCAVDEVSVEVAPGEVLGIMGETGCGKSTTVRCIVGLETPDRGEIDYDGIDVRRASRAERERFRREVQMVFQNPYASLNPRMNVEQLVGEGLLVHGIERSRARRRDLVAEVLDRVGLGGVDLGRLPRSFSGGQRQRIAIARALAVSPRLLICDEPVSALDVSVRAQIVNLLADMRDELGLTVVFIAHDPAVLRHLCDRMLVMREGRVVESGPTADVFGAPSHPYTRSLLAAVPIPDPPVARARRAERLRAAELEVAS